MDTSNKNMLIPSWLNLESNNTVPNPIKNIDLKEDINKQVMADSFKPLDNMNLFIELCGLRPCYTCPEYMKIIKDRKPVRYVYPLLKKTDVTDTKLNKHKPTKSHKPIVNKYYMELNIDRFLNNYYDSDSEINGYYSEEIEVSSSDSQFTDEEYDIM